MMKQLLFILLIFLSIQQLLAQKTSFVTYGTNEGLPQSQVMDITQDKDGYLWIATLGGLAKFNGKDFVTYSSADGLLNNKIYRLFYNNDTMWIGHEGGISMITQNQIKKWAFPDHQRFLTVTKIIKFRNKIILSTFDNGMYSIEDKKLIEIKTLNSSYNKIWTLLTSKNHLYICTPSTIIKTSDLKKYVVIKKSSTAQFFDIMINDDQLIYTTDLNGSFSMNLTTKVTKPFLSRKDVSIYGKILLDKKNNIWFTTSEGFLRYSKKKLLTRYSVINGLPISTVTKIFEDKNQNIWIGTPARGLLFLPRENLFFYDQQSGFSSDIISNINEDSHGNLWFSSFDNGITKINKNGKISQIKGEPNKVLASALDINNKNYFGTEQGLIAIDNENVDYFKSKEISNQKILSLLKINNNSMYIGGVLALYKLSNKKIKKVKNSENLGQIKDLIEINQNLYCAAERGLFIKKKNKFQKISSIKKTVYCLEKDDKNQLWVGTEDGLYILKNKKLTKFDLGPEPASNFILFLNIFKEQIYIGTNNGIFISNLAVKEMTHFRKKQGLPNLECNVKSSFIDSKGKFWCGTASGTIIFDNKNINYNINKPKLVILNLLVNHQKYSNKNITNYKLQEAIKLDHYSNNIEIQLDAIQLENAEDIKYQYLVEGIDKGWSPTTKNSNISFTSLPSGEYIIHCRAVIGSKIFSNEICIPVTIYPPFYLEWWFFLLIFILISSLIYLIIQIRIRQERQKNHNETLEYKSRLMALEQKSLNASMNRHFIFNSLNSIQYFINSQDRLSANRYLTNFAKLIRKNLDSTVEEGSMITLQQEIEGLELYLSLESMRFKDRFIYEINVDEIDTEIIKVPSMLLQPFIENSIIHGILPIEDKLGKIVLKIIIFENRLIIQIDDNGVGIEESKKIKKNIVGDHHSQGMEITSKRIDLIKKLSQQSFELIGPFQINDNSNLIIGTRVLIKLPIQYLE